jgi:hypothetical protein
MSVEQIDSATSALILAEASRFRAAIERCRKPHCDEFFSRFPSGGCGDACDLLGTYLSERGFGSFLYVLGWIGNASEGTDRSHAWLAKDGWIVDISADQFSKKHGAVIVCPSDQSRLHLSFTVDPDHRPHVAHINAYVCALPDRLPALYKTICDALE